MSQHPPHRPAASPAQRRDARRTSILAPLVVVAACVSVFWSMLAGATALDVCRSGCDAGVNLTVFGWVWGGAAVAFVLMTVGIRRARRQGRPTSPWPAAALAIICVTAVSGVFIVSAIAGML
ncbi:hypothetical protein O6P37_21805 [Mycobacterium sp. CPCC 205372]|uniref:Transmembrane protein n=1 Tax=Mycobacterium hippophais TaxID=3016340 RepID=A0ABT4PY91_9MYCO|nr:hypothetical protein [Mycobacterium hippophais]MCZ8381511.1 hypothetical protein [Mycobacterium hippophais]